VIDQILVDTTTQTKQELNLLETYIDALSQLKPGDNIEILLARSPYAAAEIIPAKLISIRIPESRNMFCTDLSSTSEPIREACFWKMVVEAEGKIITQIFHMDGYRFAERGITYFDFTQNLYDVRKRDLLTIKEEFRVVFPIVGRQEKKLLHYIQHPFAEENHPEYFVAPGKHLKSDAQPNDSMEWWIGKNPQTYLVGDFFFLSLEANHKQRLKRVAISNHPELVYGLSKMELLRIESKLQLLQSKNASKYPRITYGPGRGWRNTGNFDRTSGLSNFTAVLFEGRRIPLHWIH
jgi:hypothetical protein